MEFCFIKKEIKYDGSQLSSHFAYKEFGISGNSIVAFIGPVDVNIKKMVDIEDVRNNQSISGNRMLNFIVEVFDTDLRAGIWMQRLLMAIIGDEINKRLKAFKVIREGDDLFYNKLKLSVSIATVSPVSMMIHSALNLVSTGTPIPVSCLHEMKIEPVEFALVVLESFAREFKGVEFARVKVNWVK
ncbi:MAG: DUF366 family protein [Brevinematales bacterium]|nr:DUF366 family protein [Brevinematales bacterium]